jgi:hypothetical protein
VGCSALAVIVQSFGPVIVRKIELGGLAVGFNRCWMGALFTDRAALPQGRATVVAHLKHSRPAA